MTPHYVDKAGSLINDGLSPSTPVRRIRIAELNAAANDAIVIQGATAAAPLQDYITGDKAVRYVSGSGVAHLSGAADVSGGAWVPVHDYDYYFQTAMPDTGWTVDGTATITRETSGQLIGAAYHKIAGAATGALKRDMWLPHNSRVKITVVAKVDAGNAFKFQLKNQTTGTWYNHSTDSWGGAGYNNFGDNATATDWAVHTIEFTTPGSDADRYTLYLGKTSTDVLHLQAFFIEVQANWVVHSGDVYKIPLPVAYNTDAVPFAGAGVDVNALWTGSALTAKTNPTKISKAASVAALTPGTFYHGAGTADDDNYLFYKLNGTETIEEFTAQCYAEAAVYGATMSANAVIGDIVFSGGEGGVITSGGVGKFCNMHVWNPHRIGVNYNGGTWDWWLGSAYNTLGDDSLHGEGLLCGSTSTVVASGVSVQRSGDECFQVYQNGNLTLNGCYGKTSGITLADPSGGNVLSIECGAGENPSLTINGGHFIADESAALIRAAATGAGAVADLTVRGAMLENNLASAGNTVTSSASGGGVINATSDSVFSGGTAQNAAVVAPLTATNITPADHFDYSGELPALKPGSSLIGAGPAKWWTGKRPVSATGEPIPDFHIDPGLQSTLSPHHP